MAILSWILERVFEKNDLGVYKANALYLRSVVLSALSRLRHTARCGGANARLAIVGRQLSIDSEV